MYEKEIIFLDLKYYIYIYIYKKKKKGKITQIKIKNNKRTTDEFL